MQYDPSPEEIRELARRMNGGHPVGDTRGDEDVVTMEQSKVDIADNAAADKALADAQAVLASLNS